MKKLLLLIFLLILQTPVFASVQMKVKAVESFNTNEPRKSIDVEAIANTKIGEYEIKENDILHCNVIEVTAPKRGKRDAGMYVQLVKYTSEGNVVAVKEDVFGKYSKTVLSKEELKKIKPAKVLKKTALTVGNHFVKGLSTGVAFAKGVIDNENDNRLKSGVVNAYKESPLAYIEKGAELTINPGDEFYFVFNISEPDEPNYSYTVDESIKSPD